VPSNPESQFGKSFNPPVPAFFKDAPDMPENQNFYIIQHGIRWTGMPFWNRTLSDTQTWQLVTLLSNIQKLPPAALKEFEPPASTELPPAATKR
jgi:mono/diheme cytochrome c family protein